jgi:D-serine deaminase-like pyridoxal phosphate-dependent protein
MECFDLFARVHPPPAKIGDSLLDVDTPALCVDIDEFEKNCDSLADRMLPFAGRVSVRTHAKAHKSGDLAKLQMSRISSRQPSVACTGVCCQKLCEAEAMASSGVYDILITNQIVTKSKIQRLIELAARIEKASGSCDSLSVLAMCAFGVFCTYYAKYDS